ncbi:hypothetical protein PYW08_006283 [Mythimna loreyi]|uniref:Uncharacterized protein n=1 Tax=Mythimna loreyi TaxID=667449 RepID=A0ACC2QMS1_9NEOP|nr:hypothetical protein PYW08_006283 [Mythimna loreyi]
MEDGFVKAESTNLPRINALMVAKFFACNPDFFSAELRNVKTSISGRESYGDDAVGYVQLKRDQNTCIVKCTICPEHKVRSKPYAVSVVVNEAEESVTSVQCHDCPASEGGCKHGVAFLMWLHRRTEDPSCTSVECYWRKSNLAKVGSSIQVLTASEISKRKRGRGAARAPAAGRRAQSQLRQQLGELQPAAQHPKYEATQSNIPPHRQPTVTYHSYHRRQDHSIKML